MNPSKETDQSTSTTQRPAVVRLRRAVIYAAYLAVSVAAILIVVELILLGSAALTGSPQRLQAEPRNDPYPRQPEDYVKIAVFGGSAAEGSFSPRPFHSIIYHELHRQFPKLKFFVKNYARSGYPFHRHQAEYVKRLIPKYDFILIYCGNNEAENWYDDSGYWRHAEYRDSYELRETLPDDARPPVIVNLRRILHNHSRLYSVISRCKETVRETRHPITRNRNPDYQEIESHSSIPAAARAALVDHFQNDVREIAQLASKHNKHVLLATAVTAETWPPCFSYWRDDITDHDKQRWRDLYDTGLAATGRGQDDVAVSAFHEAGEIDDGVAILNYRLGMIYHRTGKARQARKFLRRAIDQDGYAIRSLPILRQVAIRLADEHSHLHSVDLLPMVDAALNEGIADDEMFVDVNHPSFLGHVMIGFQFLDRLKQFEPFGAPESTSAERSAAEWRALAMQLRSELNVSVLDERTKLMELAFWFFDLATFTAHPERCYEQVERILAKFQRDFDDPDRSLEAFSLFTQARLAVMIKKPDLAVEKLNAAHRISSAIVMALLKMEAWNHYVEAEFDDAGVVYAPDQHRYVLQSD